MNILSSLFARGWFDRDGKRRGWQIRKKARVSILLVSLFLVLTLVAGTYACQYLETKEDWGKDGIELIAVPFIVDLGIRIDGTVLVLFVEPETLIF